MPTPRSIVLIVSLCLGMAGCGGGCSGPSEESPSASSATSSGSAGDDHEPTAAAEPPPEPGPPPSIQVRGEVDPHRRQVTPRIESRGSEPAEVSSRLTLQRQRGDGWESVDSVTLKLRYDCRQEPPECITLAPGAVLLPPAWLAMTGEAQCECDECGPVPAGTYRFVASGCGNAGDVEGEPFELPER